MFSVATCLLSAHRRDVALVPTSGRTAADDDGRLSLSYWAPVHCMSMSVVLLFLPHTVQTTAFIMLSALHAEKLFP